MAYQITLSDQEYATLATEAAKSGLQPETFLHEMIQRLQSPTQAKRPLTEREFIEQQYRNGELINLPTGESLSLEEQAELERLSQVFQGGKPLSEIVIEDRGSY